MKDPRLDILLEHLTKGIFKRCSYYIMDQGCEWCIKMKIEEFLKKVACEGNIIKCELGD